MADKRSVLCVGAARIQKSLKPACRTAKIIDRFDLRRGGLHHLRQFIGCRTYALFTSDTVCWDTWQSTPFN